MLKEERKKSIRSNLVEGATVHQSDLGELIFQTHI